MQTLVQLQLGVPEPFSDALAATVAFLPRLLAALLILLVGWLVGRVAARVVRRVTDRVQLDRAVLSTPLGGMLGGSEHAVSGAFGTLSAWFVYALAVLAAANVLAIALLSEWLSTAVSYLPSFVAGLLVIVVGFVVADFIGDAINRTRAATETPYTGAFATGTRMFLYFTAVVIGLSTMGIDVALLFTVAQAFAWGFAAAVAIGLGGMLALGGREYVAEHIEDWARGSGRVVSRPSAPDEGDATGTGTPAATDGGRGA
jgi:small-conductance mechanosensitive channel